MQSVAAEPTASTTLLSFIFFFPKSAGSLLIYLSYPVSPSPSDCPPRALASLLTLSLSNHSLPPSLFFYLSICILFFAPEFINYSGLSRGPSDYGAINNSYRGRRITPLHITHAHTPNTTLMATNGTLPTKRGRLLLLYDAQGGTFFWVQFFYIPNISQDKHQHCEFIVGSLCYWPKLPTRNTFGLTAKNVPLKVAGGAVSKQFTETHSLTPQRSNGSRVKGQFSA